MLKLDPNRIWNTGMLIFDQIQYGHINQNSADKITIMLTWKQDEELLQDYEDSSYYQYTLGIYKMLLKYVDRSQINVVAHPRAYELLKSTDLHDLVWDKPISEVLRESKLLITDYSSVCWNSFYQGGAVIFFQPDLEKYEAFVGKLIPSSEEYVGPRVFDMDALEQVISSGIHDKVIQLDKLRTKENERMYSTINEHHDGQNTQRIFKQLKANGFV
jgi:CDP-glycerol glycerophosphotransferase (TagB/SpsB family)